MELIVKSGNVDLTPEEKAQTETVYILSKTIPGTKPEKREWSVQLGDKKWSVPAALLCHYLDCGNAENIKPNTSFKGKTAFITFVQDDLTVLEQFSSDQFGVSEDTLSNRLSKVHKEFFAREDNKAKLRGWDKVAPKGLPFITHQPAVLFLSSNINPIMDEFKKQGGVLFFGYLKDAKKEELIIKCFIDGKPLEWEGKLPLVKPKSNADSAPNFYSSEEIKVAFLDYLRQAGAQVITAIEADRRAQLRDIEEGFCRELTTVAGGNFTRGNIEQPVILSNGYKNHMRVAADAYLVDREVELAKVRHEKDHYKSESEALAATQSVMVKAPVALSAPAQQFVLSHSLRPEDNDSDSEENFDLDAADPNDNASETSARTAGGTPIQDKIKKGLAPFPAAMVVELLREARKKALPEFSKAIVIGTMINVITIANTASSEEIAKVIDEGRKQLPVDSLARKEIKEKLKDARTEYLDSNPKNVKPYKYYPNGLQIFPAISLADRKLPAVAAVVDAGIKLFTEKAKEALAAKAAADKEVAASVSASVTLVNGNGH